MKNRLTPLHLHILLHCYAMAEPFSNRSETACEYHNHLLELGLIQRHDTTDHSMWECTDKGKAHIEQLLCLKMPTQAWISASGEVLKIQ